MFAKKMNLEDKLCNHIGLQHHASVNADVFGIEVELEGREIIHDNAELKAMWRTHDDNSLRKLSPGDQAIEYVSRHPMDMAETEKAVTLLFNFLNRPPAEVFESYRTSIHVHLNFGLETFRTVYNFMCLSIVLDELLVSQNGDHRIGNNFCLRAKDALGQIVTLTNSIQYHGNFFNISENERYSSINFASLMKFGSVEFRSLECTTHLGRVMHWIGTLQRIKEYARTCKNPTTIIEMFSRMGPKVFLQTILGPYALKYISVPGFESMLHSGMRLAQDFAYCSAWNEIAKGETIEVPESNYEKVLKKIQLMQAQQALENAVVPG